MKTFLFSSLLALVLILFFASCENRPQYGPGITKSTTIDTSLLIYEPILQPRYGCDGKRLRYDKYLGSTTKALPMELANHCTFTDEELGQGGYEYTGKNRNSAVGGVASGNGSVFNQSGLPNWLLWLLAILAGLLLLALLIHAIRDLVTRRNNPPANPAATLLPIPAPVNENRNQAQENLPVTAQPAQSSTPNHIDENRFNEMARILEKNGGFLNTYSDGFHFEVGRPRKATTPETKPEEVNAPTSSQEMH